MSINWNRRSYTKEEFESAWLEEPSIAAVARRLGLVVYGSTYKTLRATAKELNLEDIDRPGNAWIKGKNRTTFQAKPIMNYLTYGSSISSSHLKKRLFKEQIFEKKCYRDGCGINEWMGQPVPLHLDHIDGNNINNCLANLRILCMNCHGQTDTYCRGSSTSRRGKKRNGTKSNRTNECVDCGKLISKGSTRCKKHAKIGSNTKIDWPEIEDLIQLLSASNFSKVAEQLGVSDNAIRKRLYTRGISPSTLEPIVI